MSILLAAMVVVGVASVTDGDTVRVDGVAVRLHGVSAPEMDEPLGPEAKAFVVRLVSGKTVRCTLTGKKSYKREVGTCFVGDQDIGAAVIAAGLARDCPRYSKGKYASLPQNGMIPLPKYCKPRP